MNRPPAPKSVLRIRNPRSPERRAFVLLAAAAVVSVIALDFIGARRGRPTYFFRPAGAASGHAAAEPLADVVLAGLIERGLAPEDVERMTDRRGLEAVNVRLSGPDRYGPVETALDDAIAGVRGRVTAKERSGTDLDASVLWKIRAKGRENVEVLFTWPVIRPEAAEPAPEGVIPDRPAAEKPQETPGGKASPEAGQPESREPVTGADVSGKPPAAETGTATPAKTVEPVRKPAPREETAPFEPRLRGFVALVMDDMGNSLEALDALLALRRPLTVSILPFSPHAAETARLARENGLDVLLHLPLESLNGTDVSPYTEGLIRSTMSESEIRSSVAEQLDRVPFISGVNNHMGSLITADARLMRIILEPLRARRLYFLDSRTIGRSVAYREARRMGLRAASRDVFLDDVADEKPVRERIRELIALARRTGAAIGIGHPYAETLQALREEFEALESRGVEAVPLSRLVR